MEIKRDPKILEAIAKFLPAANAATVEALAAEVENKMLARLWDKMRDHKGELTDFGIAVVNRVARDVYTQVRAEPAPGRLSLVP